MAEKPKILQIVADMRAEGFSDEKIIANLRQLGLSDDQIKMIMDAASKDIYSQFKREMNQFVIERIQKSQDIIGDLVDKVLQQRMEGIKKDLLSESQKSFGEFAKTVNEKTGDMALAVQKVRQENLQIAEEQKLSRVDIDSLMGGPTQWRLAASAFFLFLGVAIVLYVIFFMVPLALEVTDVNRGVIIALEALGLIVFSIISLAVGIYFTGKPGRQ